MRRTIVWQLLRVRGILGTIGARYGCVRPLARARRQRVESMATHRYPPFRTLIARRVRHVVVLGERWLVLGGMHAGPFKLQPHDEWIGWLREPPAGP